MADKLVVVDSDAIFAFYNPNDPLNIASTQTFEHLVTMGYQLVYPSSVLFEIVSLFQRVLPDPSITSQFKEMIEQETIFIHYVDSETLKESGRIFDPKGSKKNTLIDCSVVAVAKKIKARGVFSFDGFYKKHDLKLAEALVMT